MSPCLNATFSDDISWYSLSKNDEHIILDVFLCRMLEMWTNFVKFLNPTPQSESEVLEDVIWESVEPDNHKYMRIDKELFMEMTNEYKERMNFWRKALEECKSMSETNYVKL